MSRDRSPDAPTPNDAEATEAPADDAASGSAERRKIVGRAGVVAAGTLLSRVLGLVREQAFAAMFTRAATDVFFVAFLIPNVLRQLLAEGAVQNGVLPVLAQVKEKHGAARAREFFSALRGLSLLILAAVTIAGVVAAPWLVELFAGGYQETPGQFERTVTFTRWLFPYIFFMGTAALGVAALNTHQRFVVSSFAPALLNVAFVACAIALPVWLGSQGIDPLHALTIGVLAGGALQVIAQWPSLKKIGYLAAPRLNLRDPHVRDVLRRMAPVLAGFGIYYVDVVVARHLLSDLGVGAQSYFGFALRLCDFPQGIFVMAVQSATLPSLALLAAKGQRGELLETFSHGFRLALFVAVPATVAVVLLAQPIVVMIFERGHFDAAASYETARALVAQGAGIWAVAAVRQLVIVFYALGDTRSPVIITALDFAVFLAAALLLREAFGHVGISWAISFASLAQMLMLAFVLHRKLGGLGLRKISVSLLKIVISAALAGVVAVHGAQLTGAAAVEAFGPDGFSKLVPGLTGCGVFCLIFLLAAALLRCEELRVITAPIARRLARDK